ncbi:MAG: hypothetical protein ACRDSS_05480, partial [Actinocrinis sp.]
SGDAQPPGASEALPQSPEPASESGCAEGAVPVAVAVPDREPSSSADDAPSIPRQFSRAEPVE